MQFERHPPGQAPPGMEDAILASAGDRSCRTGQSGRLGLALTMRTMWLDYQARRPGEGWPGWFGLIIALMGAIVLVIHFMALQQDV